MSQMPTFKHICRPNRWWASCLLLLWMHLLGVFDELEVRAIKRRSRNELNFFLQSWMHDLYGNGEICRARFAAVSDLSPTHLLLICCGAEIRKVGHNNYYPWNGIIPLNWATQGFPPMKCWLIPIGFQIQMSQLVDKFYVHIWPSPHVSIKKFTIL